MPRSQGKFTKPKGEMQEPSRTERYLSNPFTIFKRNATDFLEGYRFAFFPESSGKSSISTFFNVIILTVQLTIAVLCGIGSTVDRGGPWARFQAQFILSLQLLLFAYTWCLFPAHDRVANLVCSLQYMCEGASTGMLLAASERDGSDFAKAMLRLGAFAFAICALFVPLIRRFYDGVIVNYIKLQRKDQLNLTALWTALVIFFLQLQKTIFVLMGTDMVVDHGTVSTPCRSAADSFANPGAGVQTMLDAGLRLGADAYAMLYQSPKYELATAVTKVQSRIRGLLARRRVVKMRAAAAILQTWLRAVLAGRRARREVAAFYKIRGAAWTSSDETFTARPGFAWLLREEARTVARERIDRIREGEHKKDLALEKNAYNATVVDLVAKLIDDPSKLLSTIHRLNVKARVKARLPPPPGMPPQLLAPTKAMRLKRDAITLTRAISAFDNVDKAERLAVVAGTPVEQKQLAARGQYGCHPEAGIIFMKSGSRSTTASPGSSQNTISRVQRASQAVLPPGSYAGNIKEDTYSDSDAQASSSHDEPPTGVMGRLVAWSLKMIVGHALVGTMSFEDTTFPCAGFGRPPLLQRWTRVQNRSQQSMAAAGLSTAVTAMSATDATAADTEDQVDKGIDAVEQGQSLPLPLPPPSLDAVDEATERLET